MVQHPSGLALDLVDQLVGMRVRPLDRGLGADEAVALAAHVAGVDRGDPEPADSTIVVVREDVGVVLERCARLDERLPVAEQPLDLQVRQHDLGQIVDVRADIAEHEGRARGLRVGAPPLRLGGIGVVAGVEAVGVLQVDHADVAEHPLLHHGGHLVHQRMAGEAVGDADDQALGIGKGGDLVALRHGKEERLLADHVQPGFEAGLGDLVVGEVGRGDGDHLDPVGALRLRGDQCLVVGIEPVLGDAEVAPEVPAALDVEVEGAADHLIGGIVAQRAGAVLVADLAGAAAADHGPAQRPGDLPFAVQHGSVSLSLNSHCGTGPPAEASGLLHTYRLV